ncbi:hypothetical protein KY290_027643 [Solanum tuberosum]|uniref:DUF4378 domain-containing protein n=1 Tax=Solanum tuberosum TaxID=4113 RepID=A0ABQ7UFM5_SOLTU|nr:hypothetical protein KY284_026509 [Solanum tuberosum]KAH0748411.1 hypothetical protein KY290_027643 [Solanum tuberosum]
MAVSSDDLCQENKEILIDFNTEETRDYSYLVEVLDEVSLTVLDYNIWNSSEYSVNSSVFDMLEKKYGKQESWHKLDRKLMFDIINSGLKIWKMLVSPKREVCKDLSDKALGNGTRWLKVEEEVNTICREIESFLFEELAAELAYY